jgi:hypothetical protein
MTDLTRHLLFIMAHKVPAIEERLYQLVPWIYRADRRYFEILLTGHEAGTTLARWMRRADAEIALSRTRLLIANDRVAGGFCAMAAREVTSRREADILDLVRHSEDPRSPQLRARIKDLIPLFGPLKRRDFYLSKFGLAPDITDQKEALAEALLKDCISYAAGQGADRLRIDVDETDQFTCELLADYDFKPIDRGRAPLAEITYLNLARAI